MGVERKQIRWNGWGWAAHRDELAGHESAWRWLAAAFGMPALLATPARLLDEIALPPSRLPSSVVGEFAALLGADRVRQDDYERAFHARGRSYHDLLRLRAGDVSTAPDAVLYPRGENEVLAILKLAAAAKIAVIPYGGGTSMAGGVTAKAGAVTLDMSGLDRVIAIDTMSGTAVAEAGIYGPALERALAVKGLTLGHFPQSFEFSTLGGWIATAGVGQDHGRYGNAQDWLCGARLATSQGLIALEASSASFAGPDLVKLLPGSQGILGVITQATVRLKAVATASYRDFLFRDFAGGITAIREALRAEIPHLMLRLSDAEEIRFRREFSMAEKSTGFKARIGQALLAARNFDNRATLLTAGFVDAAAASRFAIVAKKLGALALNTDPTHRWSEERFHAPYRRDPLLDRGVGMEIFETATQWSKLPALYTAVRQALETATRAAAPMPGAQGLVLCTLSQASGDSASLSFTVLFPRKLNDEIGQWRMISQAASEAILAYGGMIGPHHGGGEDDLRCIEGVKGTAGIAALRALKIALDPDGILNPGKLLPPG